MNIPLYSIKGEKVGTFELREAVFNVAPNAAVLHDMVIAYQANNRQVLAHTKTRAEVSGGGKKPWKQKGTGRARHGSSRSPLWVGGGITFGPRGTRNFEKKVNKKTARKALAMVLSDRVKTNELFLVENYKFDALKTKNGAALIKKLVGSKANVLVVLPKEEKQVIRCFQNIDNVETMRVDDMNVYEAMKSKQIVMSVDGIERLVARLVK